MMFMQKSGPPNINELVKDGIWEIEKPKSCEGVEDRDSEEVEVEDDTEISRLDDEHQNSDIDIGTNILDIIHEEDGLGYLPDLHMPWQQNPISGHFYFPPDAEATTKCLHNLEDIISPK